MPYRIVTLLLIVGLILGAVGSVLPEITHADSSVGEVVELRTQSTKTFRLEDGSYVAHGALWPAHYDNDGWQEIDNAWVEAAAPWHWQMVKDDYHAHALSNFSHGQIMKFERAGSSVAFQPMALQWTNDYGQIQAVSDPKSVVAEVVNVPVELLAGINGSIGTLRWDNAYGTGRHFEWSATPGMLRPLLTLEEMPPAPSQYIIDGGNPVLRHSYIIDPSSGLSIYVNGELWDKKTKTQTVGDIEFRRDGETLWYIYQAKYWATGLDWAPEYIWINPDVAEGAGWNNPDNAKDGNTVTYARYAVLANQWSNPLTLSLGEPKWSDRVRVYSNAGAQVTAIRVEVYYNDQWVNIYEGTLVKGSWQTYTIPDGEVEVSGARVSYWNSHASATRNADCYAVQFWASDLPPEVEGIATTVVRETGGSLWLDVLVPYDWLQSVEYPVYIDPDTGFKLTGKGRSVARSSGNRPWGDAPNIESTSNYASVWLYASGDDGATSQYLRATNFGFDIPSGATIEGVEVKYTWYASAADKVTGYAQLYDGSARVGSTKSLLYLPSSDGDHTFGSASDMWGTSLDVDDINSNDFGVDLYVVNGDSTDRIAYVKTVYIKVTYTPSAPSAILEATSGITHNAATVNGKISDDGGAGCQARFRYAEIVQRDDFEWGSGGDPLSNDGGGIDWTISAAGDSKAEIEDATGIPYSGTRCARLYRDGTNNPSARFSQTPLTSDQSIRVRFRRDGDCNAHILLHGNGSKRSMMRVLNSSLQWYDGSSYHTIGSISDGTWHTIEVANYDWTAGTYDIYLDKVIVKTGATMEGATWSNGLVAFVNYTYTGSVYYDDIEVIEDWAVTDWQPETATLETNDTYDEELTGLDPATEYVVETQAKNSAGEGAWSASGYFTTCPAAPTNVQATDGVHTDKVVITWTKSTGATGYKVYEGSNLLDTLGDVATYDDTAAPAGSITAGSAVASDGTSTAHIALSLSGTSTSNGASRTYKVVAFNDSGDSPDSATDTGYRGVGALTYQWQRSAGDSDGSYGDIVGATSSTHNDTDAPQGTITPGTAAATDGDSPLHVSLSISGQSGNDGEGRYYQCILNADGAAQQTTASDRGYRTVGALTYQWQRSAADSDADYSNIVGATSTTYDDTAAPAPTVTAGNATATDGTHCDHVTLTVTGHTGNDGNGRYWRCVLSADGADSQYSASDRGYRGTDTLTFQWQESAADSDADYSNITGATANPYDHTDGVRDPDGRYYQAVVSMTGAASQNSTADRGYLEAIAIPTVVSYNATGIGSTQATLHGEITNVNCENAHTRGFEWGLSSGNYTDDWSENGSFGLGAFDRQITGLPCNTQIFWRAFAETSAGTGYSSERSFTTLMLADAPTNFTITQIGPTSINITWTMGIGATGTEIRISEDGYPETVTDDYLAYNGTGTYVVIDGLTLSSITYYFRAWSYNDHGYSTDYAQAQIGGETLIFMLFGILGLGFTFGFFWKRSGFFAYGASGIWALLGFLALQHSAGTNPTQIVDVYMGLFWLCVGFTIACGLLPSLMKEKPTAEDPCPLDTLGDDMSSYVTAKKKASE